MIKPFILTCLALISLSACGSGSKEVPAPVQTKKKLVTMTYNIHHGAPENSEVVNINNIAAVIKNAGAELVAIQEVDVNVPRSGKVNQAEELAKLLGMEYYFSKSIDYNGGEYGVAILSKHPLSNKRREALPMPTAGEQRSVAVATVTLPGGKTLDFGCTHLDLNVPNRTAQAEYLNNMSKTLGKPLVIGGDYNAEPSSSEMVKLKEEFTLSCMSTCAVSFPVRNPTKAIDFMVANGKAKSLFTLVSAVALTGQYASDHLPVVAIYQYD